MQSMLVIYFREGVSFQWLRNNHSPGDLLLVRENKDFHGIYAHCIDGLEEKQRILKLKPGFWEEIHTPKPYDRGDDGDGDPTLKAGHIYISMTSPWSFPAQLIEKIEIIFT